VVLPASAPWPHASGGPGRARTAEHRQGLIYSGGGDAAIGGTLGADRIASGIAGRIDNISSVIDVGGNLSIDAQVVNNIRENVAIAPTQVKTIDTTVNMMVAAWQKNSKNTAGTVSEYQQLQGLGVLLHRAGRRAAGRAHIARRHPPGQGGGSPDREHLALSALVDWAMTRGERWRMDPSPVPSRSTT
jgi:hypothetical protein